MNEYAFALGALAHYAADNDGHPLAVNRAVPVLYPKLRSKIRRPRRLRRESGGAPEDRVRLRCRPGRARQVRECRVPQLHRIRGVEAGDGTGVQGRPTVSNLKDVFASIDLSIGTFRWTVSTTIPGMTKVAWQLKEKDIVSADARCHA